MNPIAVLELNPKPKCSRAACRMIDLIIEQPIALIIEKVIAHLTKMLYGVEDSRYFAQHATV